MPRGVPASGKRKTAEYNPKYKLTVEERTILGILSALDMWPKARLGRLFGVTPKTVLMCQQRWEEAQ